MPTAEIARTTTALPGDDGAIAAIVEREARRLRGFIRRRVADARDAEDIAQDVFFELVEATRLATPIEHVGAWLFRVAANRITDRFRKKSTLPLDAAAGIDDDSDASADDRLPSAEAGPAARYEGQRLVDALEAALAELPPEQRDVFIAHELDGQSFKSLSAESGIGVNTLLARKRYAVLHLRQRLQGFHNDI